MKKTFSILLLSLCAAAVSAQPRAIGGRVGDGLEFSYQHTVERGNVLEVDFGMAGFYYAPGVEAAFTYDWVYPLQSWKGKGNWNFLVGLGMGGGFKWGHNGYYTLIAPQTGDGDGHDYSKVGKNSPTEYSGYLGLALRLAFEYNFEIPLSLSLDWRPIIGPALGDRWAGVNYGGAFEGALCLGVRYRM
ncbi:MAG: hypothetical protein J6Z12_04625 [Paludibacteraceae bacterium]|nr:hypothetical protein [Paludibacteraceae bacterium]